MASVFDRRSAVGVPGKVKFYHSIDDSAADDGYRGSSDNREIRFSAGIKGDGIGTIAQRNANQVLVRAGKNSVSWIGWISVGKIGSAIEIPLHHASYVETDVLVAVGKSVMAAVVAIQAVGGHDTEIGELVGEQALAVSKIDIEPCYDTTAYSQGICLPYLENIEPFDRRIILEPVRSQGSETSLILRGLSHVTLALIIENGSDATAKSAFLHAVE